MCSVLDNSLNRMRMNHDHLVYVLTICCIKVCVKNGDEYIDHGFGRDFSASVINSVFSS